MRSAWISNWVRKKSVADRSKILLDFPTLNIHKSLEANVRTTEHKSPRNRGDLKLILPSHDLKEVHDDLRRRFIASLKSGLTSLKGTTQPNEFSGMRAIGAGKEIRTLDPLVGNEMLYH